MNQFYIALNVAKCRLGKVKGSSMQVSGRILSQLRGDLCILCWEAPHGSHGICLLAGLRDSSFSCPIVKLPFGQAFSLSCRLLVRRKIVVQSIFLAIRRSFPCLVALRPLLIFCRFFGGPNEFTDSSIISCGESA